MLSRRATRGVHHIAAVLGALAIAGVASGCGPAEVRRPADARYLIDADETGLMLEGNDPVTMFLDRALRPGSTMFVSTYHDGVYRFESADNKAVFDADPPAYVPLFGGHCAMSASLGKVEPADIQTFSYVGSQLVLQRNAKALKMWNEDVPGHLAKAQQNWPDLARGLDLLP